jgi:hypothetical protein
MVVLFLFLMEKGKYAECVQDWAAEEGKYAECVQEWAAEEGTCFGGGEVAGGWNRLHNEEIPDLHTHQIFLGDQMKNNEMGEASSKYAGEENYIQRSGG